MKNFFKRINFFLDECPIAILSRYHLGLICIQGGQFILDEKTSLYVSAENAVINCVIQWLFAAFASHSKNLQIFHGGSRNQDLPRQHLISNDVRREKKKGPEQQCIGILTAGIQKQDAKTLIFHCGWC